MPEDTTQGVQPGAASIEGVVPPEVVTPPEPSPEEKMAALIQQEVAKAIGQETERARRELQSVKDKATAEVERAQRRVRLAETTSGAVRASLKDLDPDAAKEVELAELRAKDEHRSRAEQEEAIRQQQLSYTQKLNDSLLAHLASLEIDPSDKRIDWAKDSNDFIEGRARFDASVAKIVRENQQTLQSGFEKRLKDIEAKVSKVNVEANSVDTTASQGVVAGSDAEFVKKFASTELPMSRANVDRYNKIIQSY